jgi:hypothetical protein
VSDELNLKITVQVRNGTADAAVHSMVQAAKKGTGTVRLRVNNQQGLEVVNIERTDGLPLGVESGFEEYWYESRCEGDAEEETTAKTEAQYAFLYAVEWAKRNA